MSPAICLHLRPQDSRSDSLLATSTHNLQSLIRRARAAAAGAASPPLSLLDLTFVPPRARDSSSFRLFRELAAPLIWRSPVARAAVHSRASLESILAVTSLFTCRASNVYLQRDKTNRTHTSAHTTGALSLSRTVCSFLLSFAA